MTQQDEIRRALAGDDDALAQLARTLTPIIQNRVTRTLRRWRRGAAAGRNVRQEVEDLVQEVFLVLFEKEGRILQTWDLERGLPFESFVGLVAERRTASLLASGRRSPWKEDPTLTEELDHEDPHSDPEKIATLREELRLLDLRLAEELSPLGRHLFELVFLRELAVHEIVVETGLSADAVYAWRSRLRRLVRRLHDEMSENPSRPGRAG